MGEIERITVQESPNGHQVFGRPSVLFQFSRVFIFQTHDKLFRHIYEEDNHNVCGFVLNKLATLKK
jgi:hypothetical protein